MIKGVLFLTAGYGTRAEPLSLFRPKCLLPWHGGTILSSLVQQFLSLDPEIMAFNSSRAPGLVASEIRKNWPGRLEVLFEERPLGTCGTLARNAELFRGNWLICNTDFAMDVPVEKLIQSYSSSGTGWTILTAEMPGRGSYGTVDVQGKKRHFTGVSVISGELASIAREEQITGGFFTELRRAAAKRGITLSECFTGNRWMDLGEIGLFIHHTLSGGSYIHPSAVVEEGAILEGCCSVGPGCIIHEGATVRNSVLLEGAEAGKGSCTENSVLPGYFCKER